MPEENRTMLTKFYREIKVFLKNILTTQLVSTYNNEDSGLLNNSKT